MKALTYMLWCGVSRADATVPTKAIKEGCSWKVAGLAEKEKPPSRTDASTTVVEAPVERAVCR